VTRVPRDVTVHLYRLEAEGARFLMLRRIRERGGFWQGVSGAPLAGESDAEAAIREVREETGYEVGESLVALGVEYSYRLDPARLQRWAALYGEGVDSVTVVAFGASAPDGVDPVLDPAEHDAFRWIGLAEAERLLEWPIESDALEGRRRALRALAARIG
jgi:8-oxo-dGTP pyrophosphatase MutT (NUDIX family)